MEVKELLEQIVKGYVEDRTIAEMVEIAVDEKFDYEVRNAIERKVKQIVDDKADNYVRKAVEDVLGNDVCASDGWGSEERYESFDVFVKERIKKHFANQWEVKKTVRDIVEERIKQTCKKLLEQNADAIVNIVAGKIIEGR